MSTGQPQMRPVHLSWVVLSIPWSVWRAGSVSSALLTECVDKWSPSAREVNFAFSVFLCLWWMWQPEGFGEHILLNRVCLQILQLLNVTAAKSPVIMQRTKLSSRNKERRMVCDWGEGRARLWQGDEAKTHQQSCQDSMGRQTFQGGK